MTHLAERKQLAARGDARGRLAIAEYGDTLHFLVRRVYWIYGTKPGVSRGFHAHKRLNQTFVCVAGSVKIYLTDGSREETVEMHAFGEALSVGPGLWRVMSDFSQDCVLMVLADRPYEEDDYIRDLAQFKMHALHV
jgi:dTDP-4-dehydrorhamnose 3,5-epimerase-like enzyme